MSGQLDLFNIVSGEVSRKITERYSTSFSLAIRLLDISIRQDIYNIYGFVRLADEIVDTFHDYPKVYLLDRFEEDMYHALECGISVNPVLHSFQHTVNKYNIDRQLIMDFMASMRLDLTKQLYNDQEYKDYIYGSADVVGLMCLKVFVHGDESEYQKLRPSAMSLGSAFQKVNFLRDLKNDYADLSRSYFPGITPHRMTGKDKALIIEDVKRDFQEARKGIRELPNCARLGVLTAYRYYHKLLCRLERVTPEEMKAGRIRVPDIRKLIIIATSYMIYKFSVNEKAW
ncbi:MAG: phytoene/squalene synthase family protein [Bacteroidota bacterium]|nr:phytoene/squalene synthase family protein [Bacteroidota bacterium]